MPDLDDDLSELQRRAYGPGGEELSAEERARLAALEAAQRIPSVSVPIPPRPPLPDMAVGTLHACATSALSGGRDETTRSQREAAANSAALMPRTQAAATIAQGGHGDTRTAVRPRWFPPALIAAIAVAAAIVMVLAGMLGWGGGYVAGVVRHSGPAGGADLVAELHPTEMPEQFKESESAYYLIAVDPETGEVAKGVTYFGALEGDINVLIIRPSWVEDDYLELPDEAVCLHVTQFLEEEDGGMTTYAQGMACGSSALDVSVDLFVGNEDSASMSSMRLRTDAYPEDTLLRFTYSAAADAVTVWSLAPSE